MIKNIWFFVLLVILICSACTPAPTRPTNTPTSKGPLLPAVTATATPTPISGRIITPTGESEGKGYALEFTHQVSSNFATLHAMMYTCSGIHGSWEGTFEVELTFESMQIGGTGAIAFSLPPNEFTVRGEAPYSGSGTTGKSCVIADVSGPLKYEITFSPDGRNADVIMGSTGQETITIVCRDKSVTIPFAVAWGPEPVSVPITPYTNCP